MYPNMKNACYIKLKFFGWTKLLENLLFAQYLISVAVTLILNICWPPNVSDKFTLQPLFLAFEDCQNVSKLIVETLYRLSVTVETTPKIIWELIDGVMMDSFTKNVQASSCWIVGTRSYSSSVSQISELFEALSFDVSFTPSDFIADLKDWPKLLHIVTIVADRECISSLPENVGKVTD